MSQYVGLDVSLKSVSICVVAAEGAVTPRGETSADPDQIESSIAEHAPRAARVVHDSGSLAIWLTRALHARGVPIVRFDARQAHKVLSARLKKSDVGDAEGVAHLTRTDRFSTVRVRSEGSEGVRVPIGTRERLIWIH